ncbi:MAG TPA: response regulator [Thermoanaerobaculaceae bacterium]|nr:response regulator [Thermoanaerobaculaceae bacterium]
MNSRPPRRAVAVLAGVIAVPVAVCAAVLLLERSAESVVEDVFLDQMAGPLGLVGNHIRESLDGLASALRSTAERCGSEAQSGPSACAADLVQLQAGAPAMLASVVAFDRGGGLVAATPPREWRDDERAALTEASRRVIGETGQTVLLAVGAVPPERTVYVISSAGPGAKGDVAAVGAAVDLRRTGTTLLDALTAGGQGVAFLAATDGRLILASGWDRARSAASLEELLGSDWRVALRRPDGAQAGSHWAVRLGADKGRARLLGVVEAVSAAGGEIVVGALVPASLAVRGARPVLLTGTLVLVGLMAVTLATAVAWRRSRVGESVAEHEVDRWRAVADSREREGRWRGLANHGPAPVVCLLGSRVVAANVAASDRLAAGERGRLIGHDFLSFVAEGDREPLLRHIEEQRPDPDTRRWMIVRLRPASGRDLVAKVTTSAEREQDASLVYLTWADAGPETHADAVLETLIDSIPLAVVLTDASGNLRWVNAAAVERGGEQLRLLRGRPLVDLVDHQHRRVVLAAMARARRGRTAGGQIRVFARGGEAVPIEFKAVPVRAGDAVTGVLFVISELGTARASSGEFPAAARERALSHLATTLAHRVSNNFQALLGLLDEMKGGRPTEETLGLAQVLVTASVEDLRRFVSVSRSGSGAVRPVRLGALLARWIEKARPGLPGAIRAVVRRETEEDRVIADASQLLLWLDVALSSSVAAMKHGGAFEVALRKGRTEGTVALTVSDTGTHDNEAENADVERGLSSSRRAAQALAELIAAQLGGRTGGTVRPGLGGRLWLELSCVGGEAAPHPAREAPAGVGAVLLADDEELVRTPLAAALRSVGYEVVEASNGQEVVEKVVGEPHRFSLVVLDLVMPVMDGREALRRLRECTPGVPVIICTGYDPSGDEVLAAADLLIKPFSIEEFLTKVADLLGRGPGRGAGGGSMRQ